MTNIRVFSEVVAALNDAAKAQSSSDFVVAASNALRKFIKFDKIAIAIGGRLLSLGTGLHPRQNYRYLSMTGPVRQQGFMIKPVIWSRAINDGSHHVATATWLFDPDHADEQHEGMTTPQAVRQTLVYIDHSHRGRQGHWMVLYKLVPDRFDENTALILCAIWPHLQRAFQLYLTRQLDVSDIRHGKRSLALISRRGKMSVADEQFLVLFKKEWPQMTEGLLPPIAMVELLGKRTFKGKVISIVVEAQLGNEVLICKAVLLSSLHTLGPAERIVATSLKEGLGYKEIARKMGTSPNTVRTQIARIYKKLEVHDKSALVRLLADA